MSVTGGIIAGVGRAGSLGSAAINSNAAQNAASGQSAAAQQAQQLQAQEAQNALNFQQNAYSTNEANLQPYLSAGTGALSALQYGLGTGESPGTTGIGQGSLTQAYPGGSFVAPT